MSTERFEPSQSLNRWASMLHSIYGPTQNYSKSSFEVLSHLTEVSSLMSKFLLRKKDVSAARLFLPKMFAWAVALGRVMRPDENNLERIILQKFPGVCAYCMSKPCSCWNTAKPTPNPEKLRQIYHQNAGSQERSVSAFQLMFVEIYGKTWPNVDAVYFRLVEELAELSEAVRIYHLYPKNFENELADFFAWWFAVSHLTSSMAKDKETPLEQLLWEAYPAQCLDCNSMPCFCPPRPMRELMSKPVPGQFDKVDALTSLHNQGAFISDIEEIQEKKLATAFPIACVRVDVDNFKRVNDTYGHPAGDEALKHIAAVLRRKARVRDRIYRAGGDEFAAVLVDCTEEEAAGLMKRVLTTLHASPVRWVSAEGKVAEFFVTTSVGVAECDEPSKIRKVFEAADDAALVSKSKGKNRITTATSVDAKN